MCDSLIGMVRRRRNDTHKEIERERARGVDKEGRRRGKWYITSLIKKIWDYTKIGRLIFIIITPGRIFCFSFWTGRGYLGAARLLFMEQSPLCCSSIAVGMTFSALLLLAHILFLTSLGFITATITTRYQLK